MNYIPINTSGFHGILSSLASNLQSALDMLDKHAHKQMTFLPATTPDSQVPGSSGVVIKLWAVGFTTGYNVAIPQAGTIKNLFFRVYGAQPGSGSLQCFVFVDGLPSTIVATCPAGGATGVYSDTTHSVQISAGTVLFFYILNNATTPSIGVTSCLLELEFNTA